jgi:hypothetical protein
VSSSRSTPSSTATDILLAAICAFRLLPNGFAHRDLRTCLAPLLGLTAEAMTSGQISYDLHAPRGAPSYSRYSREELRRRFPKMLTEPRPGPGLALVHAVGSRRDRDEPGGHLADLAGVRPQGDAARSHPRPVLVRVKKAWSAPVAELDEHVAGLDFGGGAPW